MSAATVPRRKQAKPQRLSATATEDEEIVPSKRSRDSPPSIEEQFQQQFSQSLKACLFAKKADDDADGDHATNPALLRRDHEDNPVATTTANPKLDLFADGDFLSHSLGPQQLLQFLKNGLTTEGTENPTNGSLLSPSNSLADDSHHSATISSTSSVTPTIPHSANSFLCPIGDCDARFPAAASLILHVGDDHPTHRRWLQCNECERDFDSLSDLREHKCNQSTERCLTAPLTDSSLPESQRAASEPPTSRWADIRLGEKTDSWIRDSATRASSTLTERPPVLSEERTRLPLDLSGRFKEQFPFFLSGLQPNGSGGSFSSHGSFPTPIPQFVPPSASSTPPRGRNVAPEDDWESMMEIVNTDEAEKIRSLVGDKALPPTDPNQCLYCRRVLSCKSALQMHYRTHTGERPFKCKICQRAFTTKGNLKTHMGVHRSKNPVRGLQSSTTLQHPCPICQKRFPSSPLLQQHIQQHTSQLTRNGTQPPPMISSAPSFPPTIPNSSISSFLNPALLNFVMIPPPFGIPNGLSNSGMNGIMSNGGLSNGGGMEPPSLSAQSPVDMSPIVSSSMASTSATATATIQSGPDLFSSLGIFVPKKEEIEKPEDQMYDFFQRRNSFRKIEKSESPKPQKLTESTTDSTKISQPNDLNPLDAIMKMSAATEPPAPVAPPMTLSKHQCAVCFKHFSSSSALQIHMRTHTGDRPYKCDICSRAFTTRGNLKVHMGTHSSQTSPSRRGRRIFDFQADPFIRPPFPATQMPAFPMMQQWMQQNPMLLQQWLATAAAMAAANSKPDDHQPTADPLNTMMWLLNNKANHCPQCQKVCTSTEDLIQHVKSHENSN